MDAGNEISSLNPYRVRVHLSFVIRLVETALKEHWWLRNRFRMACCKYHSLFLCGTRTVWLVEARPRLQLCAPRPERLPHQTGALHRWFTSGTESDLGMGQGIPKQEKETLSCVSFFLIKHRKCVSPSCRMTRTRLRLECRGKVWPSGM